MLSLPPPKHSAKDTFKICISRFREPRASRLKSATPMVVQAANDFDNAAKNRTIHSISCNIAGTSNVIQDDMKKTYEQGMARKNAPGRNIYKDILDSPLNRKCPLCMERKVSTLDHYLPKSHFPFLAVVPLNLIPACFECNKKKGNTVAKNADDVPLHPYYDDLGNDIWLVAKVIQLSPTALRFSIKKPSQWSHSLHKRVENHFTSLKLAELFATIAADELANIRGYLSGLKEEDSIDGVKKHLQRMTRSLEGVHHNGWRVAAYRAWSQCDWFCNGGFLQS